MRSNTDKQDDFAVRSERPRSRQRSTSRIDWFDRSELLDSFAGGEWLDEAGVKRSVWALRRAGVIQDAVRLGDIDPRKVDSVDNCAEVAIRPEQFAVCTPDAELPQLLSAEQTMDEGEVASRDGETDLVVELRRRGDITFLLDVKTHA